MTWTSLSLHFHVGKKCLHVEIALTNNRNKEWKAIHTSLVHTKCSINTSFSNFYNQYLIIKAYCCVVLLNKTCNIEFKRHVFSILQTQFMKLETVWGLLASSALTLVYGY